MDFERAWQAFYDEALRLKEEGRFVEAQVIETKAASFLNDVRRQIADRPDDLDAAAALLFLAEREWAVQGDAPPVQAMLERAIRIRENRLAADDPALAEALSKLGEFHFLAGRYGAAEPLYRRAARLCESGGALQSPVYGAIQAGLAQTLGALGRPGEADPCFEKAIALCEDKYRRYFLYIYRAEGLEKMNRHEEAGKLRSRAQALLPKNNPGEHGFQV